MIPDSFLNSYVREGISIEAAEELTQEFRLEFGRFPLVYGEAPGFLERSSLQITEFSMRSAAYSLLEGRIHFRLTAQKLWE